MIELRPCSVYVGKYRRAKVAISEFRGHLSEMDINELRLLGELSHPNIVRFVSNVLLSVALGLHVVARYLHTRRSFTSPMYASQRAL
jgi:hypothetical protein